MTAPDAPRKKRVFFAACRTDVTEIRKAMQRLELDEVSWEQAATPGTTWADSLLRCVNDADVVIGIIRDSRKAATVFFELGFASALNKPVLLITAPDYPIDQVPYSGVPLLRLDLGEEGAAMFGLRQAMSLPPHRIDQLAEGFKTVPIGALADQLLERLPHTRPREFEQLIYEAIKASGPGTIASGREAEFQGVDFAVWSSDLEPVIANPLLIDCKSSLRNLSDVNEAVGRMFRALEPIRNGCGIVLYKEAGNVPMLAIRSLPVFFVSAKDFIAGLRDTGLAEHVRKLRNAAVHGS
jgi:hypothetical protein